MAEDIFPTEQQFLIKFALDQFNKQYGRNILPTGCTIYSITPDYGMELGYEILTDITTDFLRLRLYLTTTSYRDFLENFRLETDTTYHYKSLGDEVYVSQGSLSLYYVENGIYRFRWIGKAAPDETFLRAMAGDIIMSMSGEPIALVSP